MRRKVRIPVKYKITRTVKTTLSLNCPHCGFVLRKDARRRTGLMVTCPRCQHDVRV